MERRGVGITLRPAAHESYLLSIKVTRVLVDLDLVCLCLMHISFISNLFDT